MSSTVSTSPATGVQAPAQRLNWGCGSHVAGGWINSDVKEDTGVDLVADIRRGLPLAEDSIDYAVSVHALPELPYPELVPALEELQRVLVPDGVLRLILPDFNRAIDAYQRGERDYFLVDDEDAATDSGRFIVHSLWFGYTRSLFTCEFAAELLQRAGFDRIARCSHGSTSGPFGRIIELDNRPQESFYIEARKPRVHAAGEETAEQGEVELEVVDVTPDPGPGAQAHFSAQAEAGGSIVIAGWVHCGDSPATDVEVVADGCAAAHAPVSVDRPDVAEAHPELDGAARSGFHVELAAGGRGPGQLELFALLASGAREPLGRIRVRAG